MNLLQTSKGRTLLFAFLYASEGGPIGFIWWALPTLLRTEGLALDQITGLTAMLVLPWTAKFLWAPVVDALRGPRWGFKHWIISAQLIMGAALIPLTWLSPVAHFETWRFLLLVHALAAATQDVAIDALAIRSVPAHERGAVNGGMQVGMLAGRSLFGGGSLLLAAHLGWNGVFIGLIGCVWCSLSLLVFVREPARCEGADHPVHAFRNHLMTAGRQRSTWWGLAFALTSAAAFEAAGALAGPFLVDRGVDQKTVGWFFGIVVVAAMMTGAVLGGRLSDRLGRTRAVGWFLAGVVGLILALAAADAFGRPQPPAALILGLLAALYLFIGLFTAASYALFMDLTDPQIGATQFSTFMAATNGCESWSGWAGGQLVTRGGYALAFAAMSLVSLASLPILRRLNHDGRFSVAPRQNCRDSNRGSC